MVLAYLLIFLPAFALSSKDSVAIVPAEDLKVCEYFDARIIRLGEIINEELRPDVDVHSDLYITLEESKLCDTVGYVAIPECVAKNEGDECVARKTSEMITKSLRAAMKVEKIKEVPSGEKFFATCKHIGYKNVLKTFKSARSLMSAECGLPGQKLGNRHARNADLLPALLLAGSYDPSSIWFQYFLCKDIDLYCYFFTQGWTQGQYGQYYLYDNLLDDNTGLFGGSSDSSNLATIALLGGLGGGLGQPSGYYPSYGAHAAPAQRRKRREDGVEEGKVIEAPTCDDDDLCTRRKRSEEGEDVDDDDDERKRRDVCDDSEGSDCSNRKRRSECDVNDPKSSCYKSKRSTKCDVNDPKSSCYRSKRSSSECDVNDPKSSCYKRSKRSTKCDVNDPKSSCYRSKRSSLECDVNDPKSSCYKSKRSLACEDVSAENNTDCINNRRKRRQSCEACRLNPDSIDCKECIDG